MAVNKPLFSLLTPAATPNKGAVVSPAWRRCAVCVMALWGVRGNYEGQENVGVLYPPPLTTVLAFAAHCCHTGRPPLPPLPAPSFIIFFPFAFFLFLRFFCFFIFISYFYVHFILFVYYLLSYASPSSFCHAVFFFISSFRIVFSCFFFSLSLSLSFEKKIETYR